MNKSTTLVRIGGPVLALLVGALGQFQPHYLLLGVALWMMLWWLTETVHLGITALLPLALFPALNLGESKAVAAHYANPLVYLFFGGFVLALALEKSRLHYRIALWILRKSGTAPKRVVLGFMLATGFLSMWISNTATSIMMLPIATSVLAVLPKEIRKTMEKPLLLSVAWAANIGGMATIIGTPPNLIFAGFLSEQLQSPIGFLEWLPIGLSVSLLLGTAAYFILTTRMVTAGKGQQMSEVTQWLAQEWDGLGKIDRAQKHTAVVFTATALLWILRPYLSQWIPQINWSDTGIAVTSAIVLFSLYGNEGKALLEWKDTKNLPWGILLLFGGGLALASTLQGSYWFDWLSNGLESLTDLPLFVWLLLMAVLGVFATEMLSNMALVSSLLPMVYSLSLVLGQSFSTLSLPLVLGASCAFMLPMATPPNAIVFSTGKLSVREMAVKGLVLNVVSVVVLTLASYWIQL